MARNHYSFRLKYHMPYYWSQIETLENLQYVAGLVDGSDYINLCGAKVQHFF